jgi:selenocysteine lyase/cysteine desulfurase
MLKYTHPGSFGTYPRAIQTVQRHYQDLAESMPDPFIRWLEPANFDKSREAISNLLNVPQNECVFVVNASTGLNVILRNIVYEPDDVLVYLATGYGAVEKTIVSIMETTPLRSVKVEYEMPISHGELVRRFKETVNKIKEAGKKKVKVAVFDTVASVPGVRLPFEELVKVCHEEGILSVIDGAHAVGQIHVDLGALQPDFFVSNCHKYVPFLIDPICFYFYFFVV